jgi:glycosyltransferase involved in cell wall biosynthesis
VSVIIPTYNRSARVKRAIDSALAQTWEQVEIVVVDDGSTDDTSDVLAGYGDRIIAIRQENKGVATARNTAMQAAQGDYFAFLDSDDIWAPWKLDLQMAAFAHDPRIVLAYGLGWNYDEGAQQHKGYMTVSDSTYASFDLWARVERTVTLAMPTLSTHQGGSQHLGGQSGQQFEGQPPVGDVSAYILDLAPAYFFGNLNLTSSTVIKRSATEGMPGFDDNWKSACEDYEYWTRIADKGLCAMIDAPIITMITGNDDHLSHREVVIAEMCLAAAQRVAERHPVAEIFGQPAINERWHHFYRWYSSAASRAGEPKTARRVMWEGIKKGYWDASTLAYFVAILLPSPLINTARRLKRD